MITGAGMEIPFRWGDASIGMNSYALDVGQTGYIGRPGVEGYETVGVVSGTGSDVSGRVRFTVKGAGRLTFYCGQPWGKPVRIYLSAKLSI